MIENKILIGKRFSLVPIEDKHYEILQNIVLTHADVYRYTSLGNTSASFARWFVTAQQHKAWVVVDNADNAPIGSTRLYNVDSSAGVVYIGYTLYHPEWRGSGVNDEAKFLLLSYVFDELKFNRVTFEVNCLNKASRRAVEKLGAELEGILKQNQRNPYGELADKCVYALFASDWETTKLLLQDKIK